uniref:Uncharacterized protein n=1 Tax=Strongyloides venezuelensis TaxID=75913 RepID=A0A0K0FA92_STRVS
MIDKVTKKKYSKNNTKTWQEKLDEWKELSELEKNVFPNVSEEKNNDKEENKKKIKLTKEDVDNIIYLLKERSITNKFNSYNGTINQKKVKYLNEIAIYDEYKKYWETEKKQLSHLLDIMRNSDEFIITTTPIDNKLNDISNYSVSYLKEKFKKILEKKASTSTNSAHYSLRLLSSLEAYKKLEFVDDNLEKIISFTKDNY